ncbi:MAG: STAS/SEC14 domain-containing protein [Burkholderiales bacterium]|jgi:hypothetical protein
MLSVNIDEANLVAVLQPQSPLSESDFQSAAKAIDPLIEKSGQLNGIIIHSKSFPGWDSFGALVSHLRFVRDHHKKVSRVALVTDSAIGKFADPIASHFVAAEIHSFPYADYDKAREWIIKHG